ncbi:MAG: PH domain-containing protein [Planctomycetota bacterium]|nr:PH domain-containing protein [Planctomycetota bacterium]
MSEDTPVPAVVDPGESVAPTDTSAPSVVDGVMRPLDPKAPRLWRLQASAAAALLSLGSLLPFTVLGTALETFWAPAALWLALTILLVVRAWIWPGLRYRYERYALSPDAFEFRRGVLWRIEGHVPRSRVQHTDVRQGPFESLFDLATLVIYTAGTEHASIACEGLAKTRADDIRERLQPGDSTDAV